jgi:hypothetical protein
VAAISDMSGVALYASRKISLFLFFFSFPTIVMGRHLDTVTELLHLS